MSFGLIAMIAVWGVSSAVIFFQDSNTNGIKWAPSVMSYIISGILGFIISVTIGGAISFFAPADQRTVEQTDKYRVYTNEYRFYGDENMTFTSSLIVE